MFWGLTGSRGRVGVSWLSFPRALGRLPHGQLSSRRAQHCPCRKPQAAGGPGAEDQVSRGTVQAGTLEGADIAASFFSFPESRSLQLFLCARISTHLSLLLQQDFISNYAVIKLERSQASFQMTCIHTADWTLLGLIVIAAPDIH